MVYRLPCPTQWRDHRVVSPTTITLVTFAASATAVVVAFGLGSRRLTESIAIIGGVASAVALLTLTGWFGSKGDPHQGQALIIAGVAGVAALGELLRWRRGRTSH